MQYTVLVSTAKDDPGWDAFVEQSPEGHHVQTSIWARAKAILGWRTVRIVFKENDQIAAGAQILLRNIPLLGVIGYIHRGPVGVSDNTNLASVLINEIHKVATQYRIKALFIQPPYRAGGLISCLTSGGFNLCPLELAHTATVLVDLSDDVEVLWSKIRRTLRQNIRRGEHEGIQIREGFERDLLPFHNLLKETCRRHGIHPEPLEFFHELWKESYLRGHIRLFLGLLNNEIHAALLVIPFGDTVTLKRIGWNRLHREASPSKVLYWEVFKWAKSMGYRYCDFDGLASAAAAVARWDKPIPEEVKRTPDFMKLGFGGRVVNIPGVYGYFYGSLLGWLFRNLFAWLTTIPAIQRRITQGWFWLKSRRSKPPKGNK